MAKSIKTGGAVKANDKANDKAADSGINPSMYDITFQVNGQNGKVRVTVTPNESHPSESDDILVCVYKTLADASAAADAAILTACE